MSTLKRLKVLDINLIFEKLQGQPSRLHKRKILKSKIEGATLAIDQTQNFKIENWEAAARAANAFPYKTIIFPVNF